MADFPNSVKTFRTISNRPGVSYDSDDEKTFFAEDHSAVTDEVVAIEEFFINKGWHPLGHVPTLYDDQSPDYVLRFTDDVSDILAVGQKVTFTQNGASVYGFVMSVGAYASGSMDVVVYCGTDYTVSDTTTYPITNFYYSFQKAPGGFPLDPTKWTIRVVNSNNLSQTNPVLSTVYNPSSVKIDLPIGLFKLSFQLSGQLGFTSTSFVSGDFGLSTANNSISDNELISEVLTQDESSGQKYFTAPAYREKIVSVATALSYYLIMTMSGGSLNQIAIKGATCYIVLQAVCAYL